MRRDSERPIDSSDDAWPSGLSIQSASSAAAAFFREVRNADTARGISGGAGNFFRRKLFQRDFLERNASSVTPGSSGSDLLGSRCVGDDLAELVEPQRVAPKAGASPTAAVQRAPRAAGSGSRSMTSRGRTSRTTMCALAPPKPKLDTPASA